MLDAHANMSCFRKIHLQIMKYLSEGKTEKVYGQKEVSTIKIDQWVPEIWRKKTFPPKSPQRWSVFC